MLQTQNNSRNVPAGLEIFDISSEIETVNGFLIAIIVLMVIFAISFMLFAYKLFREFGWVIYKTIGADLTIRRMYRNYQILLMFLKFDGLMLFAFSSQYVMLLVLEQNFEQAKIHGAITFIGFPILLTIVFWAVKAENKAGMWFLFVTNTATFGYFTARLVLMFPPYSSPGVLCADDDTREIRPDCDRFIAHRNFLTLFLSVNMIMCLITLGIAIQAYRNFDKGLKKHLISNARKFGNSRDLQKRRTVMD